MLLGIDALQIREPVVGGIPVAMVDVAPGRDIAESRLPHIAMKAAAAL